MGRWFFATLAGLLVWGAAAFARADTYLLEFEGRAYGVLGLGRATVRIDYGDHLYTVSASLRSAGLLAFFERTTLNASAFGDVVEGMPSWRSYVLDHAYSAKRRQIRLTRHPDRVEAFIAPIYRLWGDPPASARQQLDSQDPLSSFVALGAAVGRSRTCSGAFPIFDGRFHYRLELSGGWVTRFDDGGFEGQVLRCELAYVPVAGFEADDGGGRGRIPLAGIANRTGRLAGEHAATGKSAPAPAAWGTAILKVFDVAAGLTGDSVKSAKARGLDARAVHITANHHAGYYPGAKSLTFKLVYEAGTGRILGAQAFGGAGVDKRLDIIASLLHFRGTVADLAQVDLAYAPPFGSAKDAVHMAAFAAMNDLEGHAPVTPVDADMSAFQVVDVRDADERAELPLAGAPHAVAIPLNDLRARAGELDRARPTVVACHSGLRSHVATRLLRELGLDARNLSGAASMRDLALNRPAAAAPAAAAACSATKPCGAPGAALARDPHDELHPRNVLGEASGGALLLDVRSPAEFRSGHVEGAVNLPLDQVNGGAVKALMGDRPDATVLLLCAAGGRARTAAKRLQGAGLRTIVVAGGTNACVAAGLPIRKAERGMISIERQVRIGAGLLVAAGVALGTWVHPGFHGLSGFVGCGLVFAGVTDFCGMGLLLARMPWNR